MHKKPRTHAFILLLAAGLTAQFLILLTTSEPTTPAIGLSAVAAIVTMGVASATLLWGTDDQPPQEKALPEQHVRALKILADLPQWLALKDGSVLDLVSGLRVLRCGSHEGEPHLILRRGRRTLVAFLTDASLERYVELQQVVARQLRPAA